MARVKNSIMIGSALMLIASAFTGQHESPGGKPVLTSYLDQGGVPTICNGITGSDVTVGMSVTAAWCQWRFEKELEKHSKPLDRIPYQMTDEARVAWSDFLFNLGTGVASSNSTPWRLLVAGDWRGSCDAFLMYRWTRVNGIKRDCAIPANQCAGIWVRRNAERNLCQGRLSLSKFMAKAGGLQHGGELQ